MKTIATDAAPKAVGPYSQAVVSGGLVFCSGQISQESTTGEIKKDSVREQTCKALENLKAVLLAAGSNIEHVVKCNVYLSDISKFNEMNEAYREIFEQHRPARLTVQVASLFGGMDVEIDAIAEIIK